MRPEKQKKSFFTITPLYNIFNRLLPTTSFAHLMFYYSKDLNNSTGSMSDERKEIIDFIGEQSVWYKTSSFYYSASLMYDFQLEYDSIQFLNTLSFYLSIFFSLMGMDILLFIPTGVSLVSPLFMEAFSEKRESLLL